MSFQSLRKVLRSARKGLCSTCSKTRYPQLEAAGAGHVGCLIYTFETLGQLIQDDHDVTAMHVAARKGHITVLIYLVENKLVEGIPRAKNGATPAHDAAGTGNLDCLRYILTQTMASPNDVDGNNATPLHWAVQGGHIKVVQWLIVEAKAAIDTISKTGVTVFHIAAANNSTDIARWLTLYAYKKHSKPRRLINTKDRNGATPIYHAAHAGHIEIIRWLAEKGGGDPTIFTTQGFAPLHVAAINGCFETVKYLSQFASETAPGGLRTTEGASTMHFAASEGHLEIIRWLFKEGKCTGNERDYYQSTPLHDAAEHGHTKVLELLIEHGVDYTLTDVEGNTARDLAVKNGQTKAARYLGVLIKQRVPRAKNSGMTSGLERSRGLSRSNRSKAEMMDSYRHAPPHQLPVNIFEDEFEAYDEVEGTRGDEEENKWATLHDLMGAEEIQGLDEEALGTLQRQKQTEAETKRRRLEEDIQREKEERTRKRQELLNKEKDYEKELRDSMLAEEKNQRSMTERKRSGPVADKKGKNLIPTKSGIPAKPITLPGSVSSQELSRGLVEKRTNKFEKIKPGVIKGGKSILSKLWSRKVGPSNTQPKGLKTSQSWNSSMSTRVSPYEEEEEVEDTIPNPPPIPTVEYLMGKRPVNLRRRANQTLKDQIKERAAHLASREKGEGGGGQDSDDTYDSDGHSSRGSSVSSKEDHKHRHKKGSKHRRKRGGHKGDMGEGNVDWNYNQLMVPQSSPPRLRKKIDGANVLRRIPTPMPSQVDIPSKKTLNPLKLNFDSFDDINRVLEQAIQSASPSSLSPLNSPSSQSSPSSSLETSPLHRPQQATIARLSSVAYTSSAVPPSAAAVGSTGRSKRRAPKLQPHLQNKQITKQNIVSPHTANVHSSHPGSGGLPLTTQARSQPVRSAPIARIATTTAKTSVPATGGSSQPQSSINRPKLTRQLGQMESSTVNDDEADATMDDIELQLDEMKTMLVNASAKSMLHSSTIRPPSPELQHTSSTDEESDSETESSEYTSSSDYTSTSDTDDSSSEESSDEEMLMKPLTPKRPVLAKNIGNSQGKGGFNRLRMLTRYPRLFRKKVINLDTIKEIAEEVVYDVKSSEEMATIYHRIQVEKKHMRAWRKYIQIMKSAYRKAEKMTQRKRRDNLARGFYAWIQVRNLGAVAKGDVDRARLHHERSLKHKTFRAWHYSQGVNYPMARSASLQWIDAEQKYLSWLNRQLEPAMGKTVDNISSSLSDGTLIIHAMAYASGTNPPKFNARPRVRLHRQDNWKTAHNYMKAVGVNVKGIEPADLANDLDAAIYNMFNSILKWHESRGQ